MAEELAWLPAGVNLSPDVSPARWVLDRLRPGGLNKLANFAPARFEAYIRIFHPAMYRPGTSTDLPNDHGLTWAEIGRRHNVALSPGVTFREVAGLSPDANEFAQLEPMAGALPPRLCNLLIAILRKHTRLADECWSCLWDGNGAFWSAAHGGPPKDPAEDLVLEQVPRVDASTRRYFLCCGPIGSTCEFFDSIGTTPNLWWPDDRAWVVTTEIDSYSTYVAGSSALATALLHSPRLETLEVPHSTLIDPGSG
jgi:hypothetical protein